MKTAALVALSSSDRGQTLHALSLKYCSLSTESIKFVIHKNLKTSKYSKKAKIVTCPSTDDPTLNVKEYVKTYIEATSQYRDPGVDQLFISWKTKKAITKPTIARWMRTMLSSAGIDSSVYGAHSYRGAGLSQAYQKGATINAIVTAGDWTQANTFNTYYCKPNDNSEVGKMILSL